MPENSKYLILMQVRTVEAAPLSVLKRDTPLLESESLLLDIQTQELSRTR